MSVKIRFTCFSRERSWLTDFISTSEGSAQTENEVVVYTTDTDMDVELIEFIDLIQASLECLAYTIPHPRIHL